MTTLGPTDRLAIRDLLIRYVHGVRTKQFDLLDDVFVEDAPVDFTAVGGSRAPWSETKPWLAGFAGAAHLFHIHVGDEFVTSAGPDEADVETSWHALYVQVDGGPVVQSYGTYGDRVVRTGDGWRIAERCDRPVLILTTDRTGEQ